MSSSSLESLIGYKIMLTSNVEKKEILNAHELAQYLGVSESIVWRLVREQKIPYNKIEGRYLFFVPVIREWLRKNSIQPVCTVESQTEEVKQLTETIWSKTQGEK